MLPCCGPEMPPCAGRNGRGDNALSGNTQVTMVILIIAVLGSYLLGSIPSALWVGRLVHRLDIREHGSGNMGAANAVRVLGMPWGLLVGLADIAKGFAAAYWLGGLLAAHFPVNIDDAGLLCGAIAIIGHL